MSSDDAYMAFLNKANADLDKGRAEPTTASSGIDTKAVDAGEQIPASLTAVETYYISETDEPFEPVVKRWEGAREGVWPDQAQFSRLISPWTDLSLSITTLSSESFDPRAQYAEVLHAVRAAAQESEIKVYRVEMGSRVEYYVLGLERAGGRIVGLRATAVET